jgi:hypothetical protein
MRTLGRPKSWTYSPLSPGTACRARRAPCRLDAHELVQRHSGDFQRHSGQPSGEAEVADRLLAQALLEPVEQAIEQHILARRVGRRGRGAGE